MHEQHVQWRLVLVSGRDPAVHRVDQRGALTPRPRAPPSSRPGRTRSSSASAPRRAARAGPIRSPGQGINFTVRLDVKSRTYGDSCRASFTMRS
jgi:hypothetical protein